MLGGGAFLFGICERIGEKVRGGEDVSRQTLGKGWSGGRKETECAFLIRQLWVSEIRKAWGGDCVSRQAVVWGWGKVRGKGRNVSRQVFMG